MQKQVFGHGFDLVEYLWAGPRIAPPPVLAMGLITGFAAVKFAAHLLTIALTPYGFHRDEFLYLAMGQYLHFWNMFFPPAIAVLANTARYLFGDTLFGVRFFPALAGTAMVVLAGWLARELGGNRTAQGLAMLSLLLSPLFLRSAALFQPVVFDQLWWTLGLFALAKIAQSSGRRWWILLGAAGGLGLLTKFSILFFGCGVLVGLALSGQRRVWGTRWPYVSVLITLAVGSPSIVGQIQLGFPVINHLHQLQIHQLDRLSFADFLGGQILMLGPVVLLAGTGLVYLFRAEAARSYRIIAWACVIPFLLLLALHGKPYYIGPIYPTLFAAGAVAFTRAPRPWDRVVCQVMAGLAIVFGILTLPFGLPVVPPVQMARYAAALGLNGAVTTNQGKILPLPQDYADMLGWEDEVAAVARVYHALAPDKRVQAIILAGNYGEAGALDFLGRRFGLPRAVAREGGYWYFGPGDKPGKVAVGLGLSPENLAPYYRSVKILARFDNPWMVPEERDIPIVVAEEPYKSMQELWPQLGDPK
ncbi:MAG: glycosyltransferase family 39 protein [Candidatus Omnitrophica bacterium]|nr:glycosyltransferase family 39 protein [Candidatus Omnitrophota bacterium]